MTSWADDTDRAIDRMLDQEIDWIFDREHSFHARKVAYALKNFSTLYNFSVANKLEQNKQRLLPSIENDIVNHTEHLYGALAEIAELKAYGIVWPELITLLNKHKALIVKVMLTKYKNFYRKEDIIPFIDTLRSIGIGWRELDAIVKSVKSTLKEAVDITPQERYVIDLLFPGSFYRAILSLYTWNVVSKPIQAAIERQKPRLLAYLTECVMVKSNFSTFFRGVLALRHQQIAWPEIDELVEASKRPFITKLLTKLKNHEDSTDLLYIESVIKDAKRVVNWPELKIINDEAGGELDRARDQEIPGYEPDPFDDDIRNG